MYKKDRSDCASHYDNCLMCISLCNIGVPDPPSNLEYNNTVVIESSVDLQWTRPSYTGGVALSSYSISANGQREVVSDVRETVSYTTSGLVYGEVQVTAINTCGQESEPSSLNIPAKGK